MNLNFIELKVPVHSLQFICFGGGRGWEEQEASALLSKKGMGREASTESQQKFDFFCYDITPYLHNNEDL